MAEAEHSAHPETHPAMGQRIVHARLTRGPILAPAPFMESAREAAAAGAVLTFQGWVRGREVVTADAQPARAAAAARDEDELLSNGPLPTEKIVGLEYQVYEPMTSRELHRLAEQYARRFGVLAVDVEHSFGFVGNGQCSFVLQVAAAHRREAIDFIDEFIDAMKRHVPIWKVPQWSPQA